ncbi:polycystic kidney disease protein 1-like 2 [Branchiostoma floridae]|uniref:Polycystic kidney disease protein 1-like 2 n=1 Tax=Branchiostoma floridae TaxID=7739 RepID=A0A9J7M7W0_BRAFL|nr:polycystic kidney disease protein 1-like 2 [Branchiostoma floridae]
MTLTVENPLQKETWNSTLIIQDPIGNISIVALNEVSYAGYVKYFEIHIDKLGTDPCFSVDMEELFPVWIYGSPACMDSGDSYIGNASKLLQVNHTYWMYGDHMVSVRAWNLVSDVQSSLTFPVLPDICNNPNIQIRDGSTDRENPRSFVRNKAIVITADIEIKCVATSQNSKNWSAIQENTSTGQVIQVVDLSRLPSSRTAELLIPANYLNPDLHRVSLCVELNPELTNRIYSTCVFTYIVVTAAPLQALLFPGGTSQIVLGADQSLNLNPNMLSLDLDDSGSSQNFTTFTWFCKPLTAILQSRFPPVAIINLLKNFVLKLDRGMQVNLSAILPQQSGLFVPTLSDPSDFVGSGCFNSNAIEQGNVSMASLEQGSLSVDGSMLVKDVPLVFAVVTWKASRFHFAKLLVIVKDHAGPVLSISCVQKSQCTQQPSGQKINPSTRLVIQASCEMGCGQVIRYRWTLKQEESPGLYTEISHIPRVIYAARRGRYFVVEPLALKTALESNRTNATYVIELEGWNVQRPQLKGQSTMFFQINTPPTPGTCEVSPLVGMTLQDTFTLNCTGWYDEDGIDRYQIYGESIPSDISAPRTVRENSSVLPSELNNQLNVGATKTGQKELNLPAGNAASQYKWQLYVTVQDTLGAYINWVVGNIQVFPLASKNEEVLRRSLRSVEYLGDTGNIEEWAGLALASSSALSVASMTEEKKAEQRKTLIKSMTSLPMTSIGHLQKLTSVISSATAVPQEVTRDSQDIVISEMTSMTDFLSETVSETDQELVEDVSRHLLESCGNTLQASSLTLDSSQRAESGNSTEVDDEGNSTETTNMAVLGLLNKVMSTVTTNVIPGIQVPRLVSSTLVVSIERNLADEVDKSAEIDGSQFALPDTGLFNDIGNESVVDTRAVTFKTNPYSFRDIEGERQLRSDVFMLEHVVGDSKLNVSGLQEPISIVMQKNLDGLNTEYVYPRPTGPVMLHKYNISGTAQPALHVDIAPDVSGTTYTVYVSFDHEPNITNPYLVYNIEDMGEDNGFYRLFVDPDLIPEDNNGTVYVGIQEEGVATVSPTADYTTFSSNYSLLFYVSQCIFWNDTLNDWDTTGCKVGDGSNSTHTQCLCNHLTSFASDLFVPPNPIDFSYVFANASFLDNITTYVTIITIYVIFAIGAIWARRMDKRDIEMLGLTPLPDNQPGDRYLYEIFVYTGLWKGCGTKSKVSIVLNGERGESGARQLEDPKRRVLRRGGKDSFLLSTARPLGNLMYMRVWHDNSGGGGHASWFLRHIVVRDVLTGAKYMFIGNCWLAVEKGDGRVSRLLPVAGREQALSFQHLFTSKTSKDLEDGHIWFSVFLRPPRSRFTRLQRLATCLSLLMCAMLVSAMWYGILPDQPSSNAIRIGPLILSAEQIGVGLMSNLITFPINLIIVQLFRKSRPRRKRPSRVLVALEQQDTEKTTCSSQVVSQSVHSIPKPSQSDGRTNKDNSKKKKKRKFSFPWWGIIVAWILVFLAVGTSTTFVIFYGIQFGNETATKWITSMVVSFTSSVLVTQPIKVFLLGLFVAMFLKSSDDDDDDDDDEEQMELDPDLESDEEFMHLSPDHSSMTDQAPPDEDELEAARALRNKELKMYSIIREISVYLMYIFIIVVISYFSRDEHAYWVRQTLQETFLQDFEQIKTAENFWAWAQGPLLDGLRPGPWYNQQPADNMGPLVADKISMLVGYAIIRQLRVKEGGCERPVPLLGVTCTSEYSWDNEDHGNYKPRWEHYPYNQSIAIDVGRLEYSYTQSGEIESYPVEGIMAIYTGGGYVVHLDGNKEESLQRTQQLQQEGWLDRKTRAVAVEFSVYNAQVNLFTYTRFLLEVLPSGNMIPSYNISPVRLLSYYSSLDTLKLVCQVTYFGFLLYFMYRELRELCRDRTKYFADIWNWMELFVIAVSIAAIVAYFYKLVVTNSLLDDLARTNGRDKTYVNLQYVSGWNQLYEYLVSCLVYATTLKLFRLLRFNRRMSLLSATIRHSSKELTGFATIIGVLFMSFSMLGYLVLGIHLKDFSSFVDTLETLVGTTMGYFEVDEIIAAKPFMGTILFVSFSLSMAFVILNVFVGILTTSFEEVRKENDKQANDYEIVDFMLGRFKKVFGLAEPSSPALPAAQDAGLNKKARGPQANKGTYVSAKQIEVTFPERIDKFVSSVYRLYITPQAQQENAIDDLEYHTARYFSGKDILPDDFGTDTYGLFHGFLEGESASLSGPAEYRPGTETPLSPTSFLEVSMNYNNLLSESVESLGDLPGQVATSEKLREGVPGAGSHTQPGPSSARQRNERRIDSRLAMVLENELELI